MSWDTVRILQEKQIREEHKWKLGLETKTDETLFYLQAGLVETGIK